MKDRSDDPLHHERTLLPRSYISLLVWNAVDQVKQLDYHLLAAVFGKYFCLITMAECHKHFEELIVDFRS